MRPGIDRTRAQIHSIPGFIPPPDDLDVRVADTADVPALVALLLEELCLFRAVTLLIMLPVGRASYRNAFRCHGKEVRLCSQVCGHQDKTESRES